MISSSNNKRKISIWLSAVCFLIILMIIIGGFTRLTNSGLSITEWKPVTGIIPPISDHSWQKEFIKYQQSPEFQKINFSMEISEFKYIYMIEFIHRIVARLTAFALILPFLYFTLRGYFNRREVYIYTGAIFLLLAQGLMGWYMVKSGLSVNPHVSHFRLSSHLILAILLYMTILWQLFKNSGEFILLSTQKSPCKAIAWGKKSIVLLLLQMIFGGFVAGLKGGLLYNQFPMMGNTFVPIEFKTLGLTFQLFSDPASVQFIHRIIAYLLAFVTLIFCVQLYKLDNLKLLKIMYWIIFTLLAQIIAGILTIIYIVPLEIALIHQLGAIFLLSFIMWAYYLLNTQKI